jgi:hypothetical protein
MPSNYVSATFETLYQAPPLDAYRCIVRNKDDGPVPPVPSLTYFPTHTDLLRDFLVFEHVSDVLGERLVKIMAPSEVETVYVQRLNRFTDATVDFLAAGVQAGDLLQIFMAQPEVWMSAEYPDASLRFVVASVIDATTLEIAVPFPAWRRNLSWSIATRGLTASATGRTLREGSPASLERYRDRRYQTWFGSSPDLDAFVASTKTSLDLLALQVTQAAAVSQQENYTSKYPRTVLGTDIGG